MDIQAEKIELATLTLNNDEDWWDELSAHVKQGIDDSFEQANRGEFISCEEVKKALSALFLTDKRYPLLQKLF